MKKISAFVAGTALALTASTAFAGGPVIVEEEPEPVVMAPVGSFGGLGGGVVAAGAAVLAIAALASSDNNHGHTPAGH